jgi:hypothetical protein
LLSQKSVGELYTRLKSDLSSDFGGLWLDQVPAYVLNISVVDKLDESLDENQARIVKIDQIVKEYNVAPANIKYHQVGYSMDELARAREYLNQFLLGKNATVGIGISDVENWALSIKY